MKTPILDTSKMPIVKTEDGYYRYMDVKRKLFTMGFKVKAALTSDSTKFLENEEALASMKARYLEVIEGIESLDTKEIEAKPLMPVSEIADDLEELSVSLCTAAMEDQLGGTAGCKHFELEAYPAEFRKYIQKYIEDDSYRSSDAYTEYLMDSHWLNQYLIGRGEQ